VLNAAGVEVGTLTRDATQTQDVGAEVGALSTAGLLLLAASVAACGLAALVLGGGRSARFLLWTAALLSVLLVDDMLTLHERVLPASGIPEVAVYAVYAGLVAGWLVGFRWEILGGEVAVLLLAGGCLALSLLLDALEIPPVVLEDYCKFVGLAALTIYCFREARRRLRPATTLA